MENVVRVRNVSQECFVGIKLDIKLTRGKDEKPYTRDQITLLLYLIAYGYTV